MAKINSEYLNKALDVVCFEEKTSEGKDATIITHTSLENAILNQIPLEYGVRYDKSVEHICHDPLHIVIKCTICDSHGRRVVALGEALDATLTSDIARNNPVNMAEKRAFDRAAIRYLNIQGNVFSDQEGVTLPPATSKSKQDSTPAKQSARSKKEAPTEAADNISSVSVNDDIEMLDAYDAPDSVEEQVQIGTEDEVSQIGMMQISFGKFAKNPKTIAEICSDEKEESWVKYVTDASFRTAKNADQVNALKRYLELKVS